LTTSQRRGVEPLVQVGDDFEDEYPGASALATECFANLWRTAELLVGLHNRHSQDRYQLSPSARDVLAVVEGAGEPLEPSVIAERLVVTTGSMTSLLDNLEKRDLVRRLPHPDDRRKLLIDITPEARAIVDELLPTLHAREREVIDGALSPAEQRTLLRSLAKLQQAAAGARVVPMPEGAGRRRPTQTNPTARPSRGNRS
jgi:DNA-binding MarR family transcriptional regulator